jgi:DNA-binding transcriptional MocR family regulator
MDPDRLVIAAQAQGILLAKGSLFSPTGQCRGYFRLNVAYAADPLLLSFLSEQFSAAA